MFAINPKRGALISLVIVLLTGFLAVSAVQANSLWSDDAADMYSDKDEFTEGDLITVEIDEAASAIQDADSDAEQSSDVELEQGQGLLSFINPFSAGYSTSESADGLTQRSGSLEADITVQVEDIKENGNMRVIGDKAITINDETQIIELSGVIRPDDVTADNTIDSRFISDPEIKYDGEGLIGDKQDSGLINRLFNLIF